MENKQRRKLIDELQQLQNLVEACSGYANGTRKAWSVEIVEGDAPYPNAFISVHNYPILNEHFLLFVKSTLRFSEERIGEIIKELANTEKQ